MKIVLPITTSTELLSFVLNYTMLSGKDQYEIIMLLYNNCREED